MRSLPIDGNSTQPDPDRRPAGSAPSVLGATLVMRGELTLAEDLIVEGRFDGRITQGNHRLSIGEHARVSADILTGSAVIAGRVDGNVRGQGTVVVTRTAELHGTLTAERLSVDLRAGLEDVVLSGEVAPMRYRDRQLP